MISIHRHYTSSLSNAVIPLTVTNNGTMLCFRVGNFVDPNEKLFHIWESLLYVVLNATK